MPTDRVFGGGVEMSYRKQTKIASIPNQHHRWARCRRITLLRALAAKVYVADTKLELSLEQQEQQLLNIHHHA